MKPLASVFKKVGVFDYFFKMFSLKIINLRVYSLGM